MSRATRRQRARRARRNGGSGGRRIRPFWIMAGSVGTALLAVGLIAQWSDVGPHPLPRAAELAPQVMPADRYARSARVAQAYEMAATIPDVLDGLYCYCLCSQHSGHYSLLDCFAGDHAASCDVCLTEGEVAFDMTQRGGSLDEVRRQIDRTYGA